MLDVMILNAYHRGDWLVEQLKDSLHAIETLDISEVVGPREDVDLQGPFGVFEKSDAEALQWFLNNRRVTTQKRGWVLWTEKGTFESQGPFRDFQIQSGADNIDSIFKSMFSTIDRPAPLLRALPKMLEQTGSNYLLSRQFLKEKEKRRTVKASDHFDLTSTPGQKTIKWNEHTFEAQFVISFLLPHELMARAPVGLSQLLTSEPLRPRLCWQRARFKIESSFNLAALAEQITLVTHLEEPWFEENLLILQKTEEQAETQEWDIWFRTWFDIHKEKKYFSGIQKRVQKVLLEKIPEATITCVEAPLETTERNAHSLYPIFDQQEWLLHTKFFANGVFFAASDKCENFSLSQGIEVQKRILKQIEEELKGG
jgi:hypothetical protein